MHLFGGDSGGVRRAGATLDCFWLAADYSWGWRWIFCVFTAVRGRSPLKQTGMLGFETSLAVAGRRDLSILASPISPTSA